MKPSPEKMIEYVKAVEVANKQLVISLKRCLELLANVPSEVADKDKWKEMLDDFNKIVKVGEKVIMNKSLH